MRVLPAPRARDADALEQLGDARIGVARRARAARIASAICLSIRMTGSSAFMAPWKTIEAVLQRTSRQPVGVRRCSSITPRVEFSVISPRVRRSPLGSSPSSASAVVVLPQPDSPASPSASPRRR